MGTEPRIGGEDVVRMVADRRGESGANLNFGDCLAYGLAQTTGRSLLFEGNDSARTDIERADIERALKD